MACTANIGLFEKAMSHRHSWRCGESVSSNRVVTFAHLDSLFKKSKFNTFLSPNYLFAYTLNTFNKFLFAELTCITHTYIDTYKGTHTRVHTYTHEQTYGHMHTFTHTHKRVFINVCVCKYLYVRVINVISPSNRINVNEICKIPAKRISVKPI